MARKLLILGSAGMAGHMLVKYLSKDPAYEIVDVARDRKVTDNTVLLDIKDNNDIEELITVTKPDLIINCIGVLIRGSNASPENAIYINAYLPHKLGRLAQKINAKLIHISTDCVFSGEKGGYKETDLRDGKDVYAQTKTLGEVINDHDLTIRTSIIGPELKQNGEGLFNWFMHQHGDINGYTKAFWSGVTTLELAKAIAFVIGKEITGLVHLTAEKKIAKYDLLLLFQQIWNKQDVTIHSFEGKQVDKSLVNTRTDFKYSVLPYEAMLREQLDIMKQNRHLYPHYRF
jgi:dTDP-4-dehydrorhamnose reductase